MSCDYCWPGNCVGGPNCQADAINNLMTFMPPGEGAAFANGAASRDLEIKQLRFEVVRLRAEVARLKNNA
jgi:hypothetical protein